MVRLWRRREVPLPPGDPHEDSRFDRTEVRTPPVLEPVSSVTGSCIEPEASLSVLFGPGSGDGETLVARLVRDMDAAWRRGERRRVEDYLALHPQLDDQPDASTRLVAEEVRLHRAFGVAVDAAEFAARFPRLGSEIADLVERVTFMPAVEAPPPPPGVGDAFGEFRLVAVLGRGVEGSVFLAVQPGLADRPVVLKITPRRGHEHLSLARLQHANIVPLYWVQDHAERELRALCMPYLGGTTLARLLNIVGQVPFERRTGRALLDALDEVQAEMPVEVPRQGPARQFLAQATYVQAVCWIGACLADALDFAHRRELLHLDLKPSNILLAGDGNPMLLDFHLAQAPILPHEPGPRRLGGTPAYMPPEQWSAMVDARAGRPIATPVDGRADVYALGLMLHDALGGVTPTGSWIPQPVAVRCHPSVPAGLRDIVARCLAFDVRDRYPDAALLAEDLRRHLADLPLRGVANRSLVERWRKWRRRRPHALGRAASTGVAASALVVAGLALQLEGRQRLRRAEAALAEARRLVEAHEPRDAARILERSLTQIEPMQAGVLGRVLPRARAVRLATAAQLRRARRQATADDLHRLVDRVRLLYGTDYASGAGPRSLEGGMRSAWGSRDRILAAAGEGLPAEDGRRLRTDLLELGISWADLVVRLAPASEAPARRRDALRILSEAEALFGPSAVLERARQSQAEALGLEEVARASRHRLASLAPRTAWEHYALGRALLDAGEGDAAAREFREAVELRPGDLWGRFYRGVCAYRLGRFSEAAVSFEVCIALDPKPECYYNRARALAALGEAAEALRDYDHALRLAPRMALASLNRGVLLYREGRYRAAIDDFRRAEADGADPATARYNLALAHWADGDRAAARADIDAALRKSPGHPEFVALRKRLRRGGPGL